MAMWKLGLMLEKLGKTRNCLGDYYCVLIEIRMRWCLPIGPGKDTDCPWTVKKGLLKRVIRHPILGKRYHGQIYPSAPQGRSLNSARIFSTGIMQNGCFARFLYRISWQLIIYISALVQDSGLSPFF